MFWDFKFSSEILNEIQVTQIIEILVENFSIIKTIFSHPYKFVNFFLSI